MLIKADMYAAGGSISLDMSALKCIQKINSSRVFSNVTLVPNHNYILLGHYQTEGDYVVGQTYDFSEGLSSTNGENNVGIFQVDSSNQIIWIFKYVTGASMTYDGTNLTCAANNSWMNIGNTKFGLFDLNQDS